MSSYFLYCVVSELTTHYVAPQMGLYVNINVKNRNMHLGKQRGSQKDKVGIVRKGFTLANTAFYLMNVVCLRS